MKNITKVFVQVGAGLAATTSCGLNVMGGAAASADPIGSVVLGVASGGIDFLKFGSSGYAYDFTLDKRIGMAACAIVLWGSTSLYSVENAVRYFYKERNAVSVEQGRKVASVDLIRAELAEIGISLAAIKEQAPTSALQAQVTGLLNKPGHKNKSVGDLSKGCTKVHWATKKVCSRVATLKARLARATTRDNLKRKQAQRRKQLRQEGLVVSDKDGELGLFSMLSDISVKDVASFQALKSAVILELVSAIGVFMVMVSNTTKKRNEPVKAEIAIEPKLLLAPVGNIAKPESYIEKMIVSEEGASQWSRDLYARYRKDTLSVGEEPASSKAFGMALGKAGFQKQRKSGQVQYLNIGIKSSQELSQ